MKLIALMASGFGVLWTNVAVANPAGCQALGNCPTVPEIDALAGLAAVGAVGAVVALIRERTKR